MLVSLPAFLPFVNVLLVFCMAGLVFLLLQPNGGYYDLQQQASLAAAAAGVPATLNTVVDQAPKLPPTYSQG